MTNLVWLVKAPNDNRDPNLTASCQAFLDEIARALDQKLDFTEDRNAFAEQALRLFFVGSGGSEQVFKSVYKDLEGPYILLTTPSHNSLAASMEILSYLNEQGERGEILHGTPQQIAERLRILLRVAQTRKKLRGMRLGVTGESDWLISRPVDADLLRQRSGMELIFIPMSEIMEEIEKKTYEDNEWTL